MEADDVEARKLFCGNLDSQVDEELLYELFLQAGPLERIQMPRDRNGGFSGYCFVTFKHECSVPYAIELFEDTALFGKLPKLGFRRVPNHQRTQSAPVNFNSNTARSSSHMDFDCLLQMSKNMLNPGSSADTPTEPRPLVGGPLMGMGPPPMGGPMMRMGHPHMARPNMRPHTRPHHRGNPWRNDVPQSGEHSGKGPPWAAHSDNRNKLRVQPVPPGEEEADCGQDWSDGTHGQDTDERNISSNALSHSSLQGNWSTRNSPHMLPADGHRRTDHFSRRGRGYPSHNNQDYYDRDYSRGNYKNREYEHGNERYDNNYHPRNRSQDRHHDKSGYRSRSNDARDRKGRY